MSPSALPGVRPRLLAALVVATALPVLLPWLGPHEWQGDQVLAVRAVRDGRPFSQPERAGYLVLGMGADALLPSSTARDLNLLGLGSAVLAALAVARLRSALARGGAPVDRLLEPLAAAVALLACGPFLARAVAADPGATATFLIATAAALAWTGRLASGMAVLGLGLFVSSRALIALPVLLAAPRPRGDLKPSLAALAPWLVYAAVLRPGLGRSADPSPASDLAGEALVLGVGFGGVVLVAAVGAAVGLARGGPHRRFVLGAGASVLAGGLLLGPRAGWVEAAVPAVPWLAVLAGSGVGSLRRAFTRARGRRLGPLGAGLGLFLLGANLGLAWRYVAAPVWRAAARAAALYQELGQTRATPYRLAGDWEDQRLYELATGFHLGPFAPLGAPPLPDRALAAGERAELDAGLRRGNVILFRRRRFAVPLAQDSLGTAQIFAPGELLGGEAPAAETVGLARFAGGLHLERADLATPPGREAGGLVTVRLHWRAGWPAGERPAVGERPEAGRGTGGGGHAVARLRVGTAVVDASGRICQDLTHELAHGLASLGELGGRRFSETLTFLMPAALGPGDFGIEVAVYEPLAGDAAALEHELGFCRQRRLPLSTGGIPPGVTPHSVRALSFRLKLPAAPL